jgi:signal transduction histidine kinase
VARHSGATKVTVLLREEDRTLFLEVRDNGRGITKNQILDAKSLGLLGMRERALVFGGELWISGEPDNGTTVILKIPQEQREPSRSK